MISDDPEYVNAHWETIPENIIATIRWTRMNERKRRMKLYTFRIGILNDLFPSKNDDFRTEIYLELDCVGDRVNLSAILNNY